MKEVSQKLTLEQISKDMHAFSVQFQEHLKMDAEFHQELKDSMVRIEDKLDTESDNYILRETNKKVDLLMELYDGVGFSVRALKYVSGALLSLSLLIGVIFAFIKYAAK